MDALDIPTVHLIGNSAGGALAAYTVLQYPERFDSLLLVDAAIYAGGGAPDFIRPLLSTPQLRRLGPLISRQFFGDPSTFLKQAWHDDSKLTAEHLNNYQKPYTIQDWDRAFWEFTLAGRDLGLPEHLDQLNLPVLVISGDDDQIVPVEQSIRLVEEIENAALMIIPNCGHLPQEECPEPFVEALIQYTNR
jgi:pimeloyl-ACP methyl ester carboxylesterase